MLSLHTIHPQHLLLLLLLLPTALSTRTGKPLFGTLVALLHNGQPVLGIIDQPITRERWVGVAGAASSLNGRPISTRACGDVGNAYMYATTPHMFAGATEEVRVLHVSLSTWVNIDPLMGVRWRG
jgi:fructose-1,6-bisphosphatase/inositol monophosphatase family enzyme